MKIKEFFKRISRRILRQELQDLNNQIQILQDQVNRDKSCKTDVLLPKSVMSELVEILPSVNSVEQLFSGLKTMKSKSLSLIYVSVIDEKFGVLRLTMQMNSNGCKFDIYRRQKHLRYNMLGCDTELTTGYWSIDGIKIISDDDFELISTTIQAQKNALQDLKDEGLL